MQRLSKDRRKEDESLHATRAEGSKTDVNMMQLLESVQDVAD